MTDFSAEHRRLIDAVAERPGAQIAEATVAYDHDGQPMEGYRAHDAAVAGPKPAVIIVHDWTGLREYPKARAQMLARLGYYAFAADLYGTGRRFEDHQSAAAEAGKYYGDLGLMRARVRAAYDVVANDPAV
ncbi:dienelactone hydrolase family protein, partial [Dactylosporangium maewongense]|uniref:dienelactone hydrolase family protein n=1 Tax=Dactylosporangium maewongense TaxID=634393 RepID=UPI0031D0A5AB